MNLNFLGVGSAFYPVLGNTCAYLELDDDLLLLDCGESVYGMLYNKKTLDRVKNVNVLVTHLHADHIGSLGSLISYFYCLRKIRVNVIHPERTIIELLTLEGIDPDAYVYSTDLKDNAFHISARAVEVRHVNDMKCYGYILKDDTECVYYSGDAADITEEIKELFLKGEIDRIYHDTSTHDSLDPSHCFYGKLEAAFPADNRDRVFCMHLDSECQELLFSKGFQIAGKKGDEET